MTDFKIVTDNNADLPEEYLEKMNLGCLYLSYKVGEQVYTHDNFMEVHEFYNKMREGILPVTSQVNPEDARQYFLECGKEYKEILYLAFSSGLSGTFNSVSLAAKDVMEEHPEIRIRVIDTLCASLGQGLMIQKAIEYKNSGKNMDETADFVEKNKKHLVHVFTVDDLNHLYRGGRVSKATAIIGTVAGIKPILYVNDEGKLLPLSKTRGRKKSLLALVDYMEQHMGSFREKSDMAFISHGDCLEDAEFVRDEITRRFGIQKFILNEIGATIGAHSGPGTIALFFFGEER